MPDEAAAAETLLLSCNGLAEAALERFGVCCEGGMTQKQILMQLQSVCASYACQGVKRNGGLTDTKKKQQAATNAYKEMVVPGFLAWMRDSPVQLPTWVNEGIMGCINVNGKGKGEPKLYKDINKVWKKHTDDYCVLRRDIIPAYDKCVSQGNSTTISYPSSWTSCGSSSASSKKKTRDAVEVEKEREFLGLPSSRSASPDTGKEGGGQNKSPPASDREDAEETTEDATVESASVQNSSTGAEAATGGAVEAGGGSEAESGADVRTGPGGGGDLGPEPAQDSPDYPTWLARKAAMNNASADAGRQSGDSTRADDCSAYPERPSNWMHPLTLTFCFFGRPAGKDEDTELSTCKESSGPPQRGRKKKKGSSARSQGGSSSGGASDEGSSTENPLHPGAVRQFVGAGEAQSRAQVKKETAALYQKESNAATRAQFLQQAVEQTQLSRQVAAAVERTSADISAQRALDEEEACRKRKKQAIEDLEGELQYCEPEEVAGLKIQIRATRKKPVNQFTAAFVAGDMSGAPGPSAPAPAPVIPALPGFSHNYGTPEPVTGGGTAESEVATGSVGGPTVTRI